MRKTVALGPCSRSRLSWESSWHSCEAKALPGCASSCWRRYSRLSVPPASLVYTYIFMKPVPHLLPDRCLRNGTPLQYSCLENPMDRGAWWAAVHGVAKSRTRLSNFTFTFMHWRRQWQPTPVFLPGESQGRGSLVGCRLWGCTESDTTEAT